MSLTLSGDGTIGGLVAGGLPDNSITTNDVADSAITPAKITQKLTSGTAIASTSGTSIDLTSIPSWVKRITLMFNGVSTNGSSEVLIQLGTSGGIQATGYTGTGTVMASTVLTSNYSTGFLNFTNADGAASIRQGSIILSLLDSASGIWTCQGIIGASNAARTYTLAGGKTLSGTLDRVRITTVNGTDAFDAGSINILYE
jgi:hypothetical protein